MEETKKGSKLSLMAVLLMVGLIPLLVVSIVLCIVSIVTQTSSMKEETYEKLRVAAVGLEEYYIWDIENAGEAAYEHDYVDGLLNQNIELTLFLGDTRYITSLKNENGERNEGTKAAAEIWDAVSKGYEYHAEHVKIGGKEYFVYYVPMIDHAGKVVGMAFAGEAEDRVNSEIRGVALRFILIAILIVILVSVINAIIASRIRAAIGKVVDTMSEVANGNLSINTRQSSPIREIDTLVHAAGRLEENMKNTISEVVNDAGGLDTNMGMISTGVEACNHAAEGIALAVEELAKGTMDMAESVQNTAQNMHDMGEDISEITSLAEDATAASNEVKRESGDAKAQLAKLMSANNETVHISNDVVSGINESAEAVDSIRQAAEMIASIASQTSLLALNASIEAARAGEAGRGFAVVAGEISNLATQSDASTQEIQSIVSEIIKSSEHNITLANRIKTAVDNEGQVLSQVSHSFDIVNQKIDESAEAIQAIADKTVTLDAVKAKVLDEINTLSAISQEDAAGCQETNASVEEFKSNIETINQQAMETQDTSKQLLDSVSYFRI